MIAACATLPNRQSDSRYSGWTNVAWCSGDENSLEAGVCELRKVNRDLRQEISAWQPRAGQMLLAGTPARTFVGTQPPQSLHPASTNCDGKIINSSRLAHHGLTKSEGLDGLDAFADGKSSWPSCWERNEEGYGLKRS